MGNAETITYPICEGATCTGTADAALPRTITNLSTGNTVFTQITGRIARCPCEGSVSSGAKAAPGSILGDLGAPGVLRAVRSAVHSTP